MQQDTSYTFPIETAKNIGRLALSPNGTLLVAVDVDGRAMLLNVPRRALLGRLNFKAVVDDLVFSPCGRFFAVTHDKQMHVWRTPGLGREFAPFALHRRYVGHHDRVTSIDWSHDSQFIVTGSRDSTCRVYTLNPLEGYSPVTFTAHRDRIISAFFVEASLDIYSVSRDGTLLVWRHQIENQVASITEGDTGSAAEDGRGKGQHRWTLDAADKHYFLQDHAKVVCAVLHRASDVLTVGFSNGVFGLYEMPDFNNIHTLSISSRAISTAAVNRNGEWLAFGCGSLGQLLVWEWQSETYVLKQQGHQHNTGCISYSPDARFIASGGADGKVKLWSTASGFSVVTFSEHSGEITGLTFAQSGLVVLSSSLDGSVRAFDLVRYRNFRTFTSPEPTQFSSVAVDASGELVCAGTVDAFSVCLWSMKTGRLLEMIPGHTGPIAGVAFSPVRTLLASASWDGTARLWDIFEHGTQRDVLEIGTDVMALAFRPDGREVACSSLNGQLNIFDVTGPAKAIGSIDCKKDVQGGRLRDEYVTAQNRNEGRCFTSICYSADGTCLLAGGATQYVCIYELGQRVLLKRFCISSNRSLDGVLHRLNSKKMGEAGSLDAIDMGAGSDDEKRDDVYMPGVTKGDLSSRRVLPEIRTTAVQYSPTGRSWAVASTVGVLIYSLDDDLVFDPFDLGFDVTPAAMQVALQGQEYCRAAAIAFRLGEQGLARDVIQAVPPADVSLVAQEMPRLYVGKLLALLAQMLKEAPHVEFYLHWVVQVLNSHGQFIRDTRSQHMTVLRLLHQSLSGQHDIMARLCEENRYTLQYYLQCKVTV